MSKRCEGGAEHSGVQTGGIQLRSAFEECKKQCKRIAQLRNVKEA